MSEEINKNFKGLYDTSKTTIITDRTEPTHFYEPEVKTPRIKNVSYSINFDKKELYKQIEDLQQKVEQLEKENISLKEANNYHQEVINSMKEPENAHHYHLENIKLRAINNQLENIRKDAIEELSYMSTDAYVEDYDIREKHYNLLMNKLNKGE